MDFGVIFLVDLGEFFVIWNVVNVVLLVLLGIGLYGIVVVIEYVVIVFNVKMVIVLGYMNCGGVVVVIDKLFIYNKEFIEDWVVFLD